eukprot:331361-Amphidinium_carterae.1
MPLPSGSLVGSGSLFKTPLLGLMVDVDLLTAHIPTMLYQASNELPNSWKLYGHNSKVLDTHFPKIRIMSECLLLAYLRVCHVCQQVICVNHNLYPQNRSHSGHHPTLSRCTAVTHQLKRNRSSPDDGFGGSLQRACCLHNFLQCVSLQLTCATNKNILVSIKWLCDGTCIFVERGQCRCSLQSIIFIIIIIIIINFELLFLRDLPFGTIRRSRDNCNMRRTREIQLACEAVSQGGFSIGQTSSEVETPHCDGTV